jgi:hypothetical protein
VLYESVAATLDPALRAWLEGGRRMVGDPRPVAVVG